MKINLKNRPVKATAQTYERFLKELEKELREELASFNRAREDKKHSSGLTQFGMGLEHKIREILGETQS